MYPSRRAYSGSGAGLSRGNEGTERLYTGQRWDWAAQVYYYHARFYDPRVANFLTIDPVRQGANPYSYVAWSPARNIDPTGMFGGDGGSWGGALTNGMAPGSDTSGYATAGGVGGTADFRGGIGHILSFNYELGYFHGSAGTIFAGTGFFHGPDGWSIGRFSGGGGHQGWATGGLNGADPISFALGAYIGVGLGGFVTNASSVWDLTGGGWTVGADIGLGPYEYSIAGSMSGPDVAMVQVLATIPPVPNSVGIGAGVYSYPTFTTHRY